MATGTCVICKKPATKKVIWADGRAFQPSCDEHVKATQDMLTEKNGEMTELSGVTDLAVPSAVYPDLERKPGGPDNWVEKAGGLPEYIERIAKHLHYEKGFTISRAIATAVNTVKRWARGGGVTKTGSKENVTPATIAKAAAALASWEAKKASARADLSATLAAGHIDLSEAQVDVQALAIRANAVADPEQRALARRKVLDLAGVPGEGTTIDLAALTQDGRKSFKKQGKWGHGFVPLDEKAKEAKAKGSPIAKKRINRLFGGAKRGKKATPPAPTVVAKKTITVASKRGGTRKANTAGLLRNPTLKDASRNQKVQAESVANRTKVNKRSTKEWDSIPDEQKTIRNGKRYVLTTFGGKQMLTEHVGPNDRTEAADDPGERVYTSIDATTIGSLTNGQLRRLLEVPGQPEAVKKKIGQALRLRQQQERENG